MSVTPNLACQRQPWVTVGGVAPAFADVTIGKRRGGPTGRTRGPATYVQILLKQNQTTGAVLEKD